ncbi:MAG: hypothetical protein ABJA82_15775 [Myxococcales bacterium]
MSPAELFDAAARAGMASTADKDDLLARLRSYADGWRGQGRHFDAGFAMMQATIVAWGNGDEVLACTKSATDDFLLCIDRQPLDSKEALAAIVLLGTQLRDILSPADVRRTAEGLHQELAQRLSVIFADCPEAIGYLVRGFHLSTIFEGPWTVRVPSRAMQEFGISMTFGSGGLTVNMPSACDLFWGLSDYRSLMSVVDRYPEEFLERGMLGRKLATEGFLNPVKAADLFARAAVAFGSDTHRASDELLAGVQWNGQNVQLWAKYFRAQAALARIRESAQDPSTLLREASDSLAGTESGMVNHQVSRLRILVHGLASLCGAAARDALTLAKKELAFELERSGEATTDQAAFHFLKTAEIALDEFATDPSRAVVSGSLRAAMDALNRLPQIGGSEIANAVAPAVGRYALGILDGPTRTFVHRALEGIVDERMLQKLFFRLAQGSLPRYAQIRHGPVEYGKDVVVLTDEAGSMILRMYQMKCGDITMKHWPMVKNQLEQIFQVPLVTINIHEPVDARVGVLVCNGHVHPFADPVIHGWRDQQAAAGRRYEFMQVDDLVKWIFDQRLVNEFRAALTEAS